MEVNINQSHEFNNLSPTYAQENYSHNHNLYSYKYYEEYKTRGLELRPNQMMPNTDWDIWLVSAGRGFGKTVSGAAAVDTLLRNGAFKKIAIIGATLHDARHIMCNSLLKVNPKIKLESSKHKVSWENGGEGYFFGGDPEKLRGFEFDLVWIDEFIKFKKPVELFQQVDFCLRLKGEDLSSKIIITTTPNNSKILENIAYDPKTFITYGTSYDNEKNLSSRFFKNIENYKNTDFGEQEIYGKIVNDALLWRPFHIKHLHKKSHTNVFFQNNYDKVIRNNKENPSTKEEVLAAMYGRLQDKSNKISELDADIINRINEISFTDVVDLIDEYTIGVDPAFGGKSETGIILVGVTKNNQYYVLEDLSGNYSCSVWTRIVRHLSMKFSRCSISIETNHGGGIFREIFGGHMYIKENRATESKLKRSVASLLMYENSEVIHYKPFKFLEGQMLNFRPNSNDRVDALVWALKFLKNRYNPNYWHDEFNNKEEENNLADEKNVENFNLTKEVKVCTELNINTALKGKNENQTNNNDNNHSNSNMENHPNSINNETIKKKSHIHKIVKKNINNHEIIKKKDYIRVCKEKKKRRCIM